MPKLESTGLTQKISLSQIIDTGNVREDYRDIEELAKSIKDNGLMQPIVVKRAGLSPEGLPQFELIAGHRRKKAFEYLCSKGDDFSMIEAVIKTGDKLSLQLIENIQRSDLTAAERESGLFEMLNAGFSQKEIAVRLSKSEDWVSKHLAAQKVRTFLNKKNINTEKLETSTLNLFRTIPESDLINVIEKTLTQGGTRAVAESVIREYKNSNNKETSETFIEKKPYVDNKNFSTENKITNKVIEKKSLPPLTFEKPKPASKDFSKNKTIYNEEIEPEDKLISSKFVFNKITDYIKAVNDKIKTLEDDECKNIQKAKIEAAYDIIALLHTRN